MNRASRVPSTKAIKRRDRGVKKDTWSSRCLGFAGSGRAGGAGDTSLLIHLGVIEVESKRLESNLYKLVLHSSPCVEHGSEMDLHFSFRWETLVITPTLSPTVIRHHPFMGMGFDVAIIGWNDTRLSHPAVAK